MAINKRLISYPVAAAADSNLPSEYFNTVLYTGNGGTQRVGGYINRGFISKSQTAGVEIPNVENLFQKKDTEFSVSLWFNGNPNAYAGEIFSDYATQSFTVFLNVNPSGYLQGSVRMNSSEVFITSSTTVNDGEWHNVVYTYKNSTSTINMYLDGSLVGSGTIPSSSYYSASGTNIKITAGSVYYPPSSSYSHGINGVIDQLRIFNKEVSSSEVTTLYGETHASTTIGTTDIFSDGSGVALYQFDGNANDTGGVNGKFGAAAIFNGSSSYISTGINANNITTISYSFWAFIDSNVSGNVIGGTGNDGSSGAKSNRQAVGLNASVSRFEYITRQGDFARHTLSVSDGWHHFVVTDNNGTTASSAINMYIDGTPVSFSEPTSNNNYSTNTNLQIGRTRNNAGSLANYFNGLIDDVRIYSDVLTSTEVGYLYNNTTASIPTDNLVAYYKLDGNALDSANSFDGTDSNVAYGFDGTASNVVYQEATNFTPDLVWVKTRSLSSGHVLRSIGMDSTYTLSSNSTAALNTVQPSGGRLQLANKGFVVSDISNNGYGTNGSNQTQVAWCFNAGTGAAALNEQGSIDSNVKANQDAGFSIVKYTGNGNSSATVGHGLSSTPELLIAKSTSEANNWWTGVKDVNGVLQLDSASSVISSGGTNGAIGIQSNYTSNVFGFLAGTSSVDNANKNGQNYIAYCFHSVDGIQKIGSYTGTGGSVNVETGFEPAWIMIKRTDSAEDWKIIDNKRDNFADALEPNEAISEENNNNSNFIPTSNGFQMNDTSGDYNANNGTYIYLAIAADPDTTTPVVENSFDVVTYTGNGGTQDIDVAFKPDLVWIKAREASGNNLIQDTIRGTAHQVYSNLTFSTTTSTGITAFNTNGFTLSDNANGDSNVNGSAGGTYSGSTAGYVAWCWKAGDHDDNLPEINTNGTTDSIVSVNDAAGFSIVKYSGSNSNATIGHGLSSPPEFIMVKNISSTNNWCGSSQYIGWDNIFGFDYTLQARDFDFFLDTTPTSQVFSVKGNIGLVNDAGEDYIAYCFKSITSYQKIGSYSGGQTLNTDNIVDFGFKPRFVMVKNITAATGWIMIDSARPNGFALFANDSGVESDYSGHIKLSSSGLRFDGNNNNVNASGNNYFYLAIK